MSRCLTEKQIEKVLKTATVEHIKKVLKITSPEQQNKIEKVLESTIPKQTVKPSIKTTPVKTVVKTVKPLELSKIYKQYEEVWTKLNPNSNFDKKENDHTAKAWKTMTTKLENRYKKEREAKLKKNQFN